MIKGEKIELEGTIMTWKLEYVLVEVLKSLFGITKNKISTVHS